MLESFAEEFSCENFQKFTTAKNFNDYIVITVVMNFRTQISTANIFSG